MTRNLPGRLALPFALSAALALPAPVFADPPAHAPAHGWRKKHDPDYRGYSGRNWDHDYGIRRGVCSAEAVGAVVGGVLGGVVGSQVGEGDGRRIATVLGTVIGAVIGAEIARDFDDLDRACLGHALELSTDGHRVAWTNPHSHVEYLLVPVRSFRDGGRACREFELSARGRTERRRACADGEGRWRMT